MEVLCFKEKNSNMPCKLHQNKKETRTEQLYQFASQTVSNEMGIKWLGQRPYSTYIYILLFILYLLFIYYFVAFRCGLEDMTGENPVS